MTLYKVISKDANNKGVIYGCRDRVLICDGVRFDVYIGDAKVLRGIFRKDEGRDWKIECKCDDVVEGVKDAEVAVATDGHVAVMSEKVEMRRRRRRRCCVLEDIPEEREEGSDVCGCSECGGGDDDDDEGVDGGDEGEEVEVEGVGWAVDVGIWVVCIGVGYLVSRASSSKRLRRMRFV